MPNLEAHAPTQCFVDVARKTHLGFSHASSIQKTYRKPFQNDLRTLPKLMLKTCCFPTSVFQGFGFDFGASWVSKSTALLAAPGVLNPTAFHACINILLLNALGEANGAKNGAQTWANSVYVGTMLAYFSHFLHFLRKITLPGGIRRKNHGFAWFGRTKNRAKLTLGAGFGLCKTCLGLSGPVLGSS